MGAHGTQGIKHLAFFAFKLDRTVNNAALGKELATTWAADFVIFVLHTL